MLTAHLDARLNEMTVRARSRRRAAASVADRRRGPLGPLLSEPAEVLVDRGLLEAGDREEELVVICGRRDRRRPASVEVEVGVTPVQRDEPAPHGDQRAEDEGDSQHEHSYRFVSPAT